MAALRVRIIDGSEFVVHMSREELTKKFRNALDDNTLLEVKNGDGRVRVVNPHQIVFFEDVEAQSPESTSAAAPAVATD